jgi:hypothetical protein
MSGEKSAIIAQMFLISPETIKYAIKLHIGNYITSKANQPRNLMLF